MSLLEKLPKNLLRLILNKVGDLSLFKFCQMSQATDEFCQADNQFWIDRIGTVFGEKSILPSSVQSMWPYYKSAKRKFLKDTKDWRQLANYAIRYESKLDINIVFMLYQQDRELYDMLNDEIYGSDKLAVSIYYEKEDEFHRLSKMGFHASRGTLGILLDHMARNATSAQTLESYVRLLSNYKPYFGESFVFPSNNQIRDMLVPRLKSMNKYLR